MSKNLATEVKNKVTSVIPWLSAAFGIATIGAFGFQPFSLSEPFEFFEIITGFFAGLAAAGYGAKGIYDQFNGSQQQDSKPQAEL